MNVVLLNLTFPIFLMQNFTANKFLVIPFPILLSFTPSCRSLWSSPVSIWILHAPLTLLYRSGYALLWGWSCSFLWLLGYTSSSLYSLLASRDTSSCDYPYPCRRWSYHLQFSPSLLLDPHWASEVLGDRQYGTCVTLSGYSHHSWSLSTETVVIPEVILHWPTPWLEPDKLYCGYYTYDHETLSCWALHYVPSWCSQRRR